MKPSLCWLWIKAYWREVALIVLSVVLCAKIGYDIYVHNEEQALMDMINELNVMIADADNQISQQDANEDSASQIG